ncbi:hypothetical protein PROPEN_03689 [Proteus penneri ATCC 35198]|nr:hypothetical protein PROPEN_03689 [Proteus penneri ATCC 35198]
MVSALLFVLLNPIRIIFNNQLIILFLFRLILPFFYLFLAIFLAIFYIKNKTISVNGDRKSRYSRH